MADLPNIPGGVPPNPDELAINAPVTAQRMNICLRKLQELTRDGVIPCVRIGRRVLYRPEAVRAALAKLEGQSGAK